MLGKRLINSNSAAAGGSCTTDTLQILGDTSCVAYYKMSDATDESGNYDGTATNVNFNVAGKFGNAGSFNGSSSVIDLGSPLLGQTHSVSLWFNADSIATDTEGDILFAQYTDGVTGRYVISIYTNTMRIFVGGSPIQTISATWTANAWTHFVIVKNSSGYEAYVNGSSIGTSSLTSNIDTASNTTIGAGRFTSPFKVFPGSIDQVRIFNKALTSNEVTTLNDEVYCVPTIVPTDNFTPITYTGNGGTQSTNSLSNQSGTINFKPDFSWIKVRSTTNDHTLQNSISGTSKFLRSNTTDAEGSNIEMVTSYNSNGFSLGPNALANQSSETYVAWNWKAGGADVLNEEGTIDSQVSANVDAGFSIVSYTGNGNISQQSYGHNLSQAPELVINKAIDTVTQGTNHWIVGGTLLGNGGYMFLSLTNAKNTASSYNGNQVPDSNVVYISGTSDLIHNENNKNFISYCFHSVDGYSKIGSTVGTGASNFIYTGFRPAFVMFKEGSTAGSWFMIDNKRGTDKRLLANAPDVEGAITQVSFSSNGFEVSGGFSSSSTTYIFMAFAEEVFNPNGVTRNATNPFGDASELALYKFEDNANDAEGSYNGTFTTPSYATGYIGNAAYLNGSTSKIGGLPLVNDNTTVSYWFNSSGLTGNRMMFSTHSSGSDGWEVNNDGATLGFVDRQGLLSNKTGIFSAVDSISTGVWYHCAITTTTNQISFYLNGQIVGTASKSTAYTSTNTFFGLEQFSNAYYWRGYIDQARFFNRALDSGEVTQLYNE